MVQRHQVLVESPAKLKSKPSGSSGNCSWRPSGTLRGCQQNSIGTGEDHHYVEITSVRKHHNDTMIRTELEGTQPAYLAVPYQRNLIVGTVGTVPHPR